MSPEVINIVGPLALAALCFMGLVLLIVLIAAAVSLADKICRLFGGGLFK